MTERVRIQYWGTDDRESGNIEQARQVRANLSAAYYGQTIPHPVVVLSDSDARAQLIEAVAHMRRFESRYPGECDLTDARIAAGDDIYYMREGQRKRVLLASAIDEIV